MKKKSVKKRFNPSKKLLKFIVYFLILVAIGVIIGFALNFFFNRQNSSQDQAQTSSLTASSGGINFTTNLPKESVDLIANFLKAVYQDEYIPTELEIKLVTQAEQSGDQYVGIWTASDKVLQVLFVTGNKNTTPRYFRTWALDTGVDINQKLAETSITAYFRPDFIQQVGTLSCNQMTNPESVDNEKITDCGSVKPDSQGNKVGISVRAPILTQTNEKGTLTAACSVPKDAAIGYLQKTCI